MLELHNVKVPSFMKIKWVSYENSYKIHYMFSIMNMFSIRYMYQRNHKTYKTF